MDKIVVAKFLLAEKAKKAEELLPMLTEKCYRDGVLVVIFTAILVALAISAIIYCIVKTKQEGLRLFHDNNYTVAIVIAGMVLFLGLLIMFFAGLPDMLSPELKAIQKLRYY